ncbi:peptide deformylase [Chitinophaga sancti]|uniref:Peptide deformylase n=1 Tax=Chitinophaga sancti TaxID=1004 RepID=A0A1K1PUQ5_9BACT|nr:peptide deformylase [Chitinophaga sancti]WQD61604.1 peptide deformylase [Chitinophaga sancti]WQG92839.1 peptide deformylase [Chitinophaga sancti]SFW51392.1 peptide deformylase [Chitinophaga sancti]
MILPIVAYGHPVLRKVCEDITPEYPDLNKLIANMWETMYASSGVGLAAPQINRPIRLFVIDSEQIINNLEDDEKDEYPGDAGVKRVFINAQIINTGGEDWPYNEGCLSIPKVREDVYRPETVTIKYVDENFQPHEDTFTGVTARVIFHEYDHIDGKLFIDHLKPLKRRMIKSKLDDISKGKIKMDYKMIFHK